MDVLLSDLRHSVRNLLRAPGFALLTVATLALGIGANTAIFSVVNAVLLRPLAYPRPEQLVYISSQFPAQGFDQFWISPPEFFEFKERVKSFASVGAFATGDSNLTALDRPRRVHVALASDDLFTALGVAPRLGRAFDVAETRPGGAKVALLSYEVWQSSFGGDASIVGTQVEIDGVRRDVLGVMPPRFDVADQHVEVWLPLVLDPARRDNRGNHYLYLLGRLRDGVTFDMARAELTTVVAGWRPSLLGSAKPGPDGEVRVHAPDPKGHPMRFDRLQAQIVGGAKTAVLVLQGAVAFVLLIACANLANLLLARAETRSRDFAIRAALGARRGRLVVQFLAEGCVLSLVGAALGVLGAHWGLQALLAAFPDSLPRAGEIALDARVLAFTLVLALATGAVFGLAPLLHLSHGATTLALKEGGQRSTGGRGALRRVLVVAEVALAVSLVIGSGLLLRTVWNLSRVDAGFRRAGLVTFLIDPPAAVYKTADQVEGLYRRLLDRLAQVPGVGSVAAMSGMPPVRQVDANDTTIEGFSPKPGGPFENVDYYQIASVGYTETMGIPLVEGRSFDATDAVGAPVVLVNQTMARTFWPGQSPVGRRVRPCCSSKTPWLTVVGVVKDVKQGGVDRKTGTELYFNFEQVLKLIPSYTMNVVMRTTLSPEALAATTRQIVSEIDPTLPVVKLRTMDDVFGEAIGRPRLLADLLLVFAALALLLAALGSYAVLAYMVTARRREIGIRMALGADRESVLKMVLGQGASLTGAGIMAGLAIAFGVNRLLASLLFGIQPFDPATVAVVIAVMTMVALVACYLPARSATAVDPMVVLRDE